MNGYRFLTNFHIREYDSYVEKAKKANSIIGEKSISVSKKAHSNGQLLEESGSIWYKCTHDELQIFHQICDEINNSEQ
jgi:hypothetical protein